MKTVSAFHAEPQASSPADRPVLVWDLPVRVFHWAMVMCFAGAWITSESERWQLLHVTLGYTMGGLVAFRLLWGLVGTKHARFASFVRGPTAVKRYVFSLLGGRPEHHAGHNPAGAWAIVGLLVLAALIVATGHATFNELGGDGAEDLHEVAAQLMMALVAVHLIGVVASSWLHHENLVHAMWSGRKAGQPGDSVRSAWRSVAALMIAAIGIFWWTQWQSAPMATADNARIAAQATNAKHAGNDGDDD